VRKQEDMNLEDESEQQALMQKLVNHLNNGVASGKSIDEHLCTEFFFSYFKAEENGEQLANVLQAMYKH
jgi:type II secretory pathway component PulF